MYPAKAIANYFLNKSKQDSISLSPLKMIKLVYISHGWHLGFKNKPLIEEYVQAWDYGPVISELYHEFKIYGNQYILDYAKDYVEKGGRLVEIEPQIEKIDSSTQNFLDDIWDIYKDYSVNELMDMTHQEGTPWAIAFSQESIKRNPVISDQLIGEYYKGLIDGIRQRKSNQNNQGSY